MRKHTGFTLAELLVAISLLAVIALFTLPKVLHAGDSPRQAALLKENVAALEEAYYSLRSEGALENMSLHTYLIQRINLLNQNTNSVDDPGSPYDATIAPFNVTPHPCSGGGGINAPTGWMLFSTGIVVSGTAGGSSVFGGPATVQDSDIVRICIDIDGAGGQNVAGVDVFQGFYSTSPVRLGGNVAKRFRWDPTGGPSDAAVMLINRT